MPTPSVASDPRRSVTHQVFRELGYDLAEIEDVRRLAADLRWCAERRRHEESSHAHWLRFATSSSVALIGVSLTLLGQWITRRLG